VTARNLILAVLLLTAGAYQVAAVQQVKSLYTVIDLKSCKIVKARGNEEAHLCEGLPGYPIYIASGDRRTYVSAGVDPEKRRAATQTLGPFNTLFEGNSTRTTVEWRFVIRNGQTVPYATIVRYFTEGDTGQGQVLVVMRVTEMETCHVAHVDARAHGDAIMLARELADERARAFDCNSPPSSAGPIAKRPLD
jgi:hypothetical protein